MDHISKLLLVGLIGSSLSQIMDCSLPNAQGEKLRATIICAAAKFAHQQTILLDEINLFYLKNFNQAYIAYVLSELKQGQMFKQISAFQYWEKPDVWSCKISPYLDRAISGYDEQQNVIQQNFETLTGPLRRTVDVKLDNFINLLHAQLSENAYDFLRFNPDISPTWDDLSDVLNVLKITFNDEYHIAILTILMNRNAVTNRSGDEKAFFHHVQMSSASVLKSYLQRDDAKRYILHHVCSDCNWDKFTKEMGEEKVCILKNACEKIFGVKSCK